MKAVYVLVAAARQMTLVGPPSDCVPHIGRQAVGNHTKLCAELQPFACGMSGRTLEVLEPQDCQVQGGFPDWLQGQLYRNGPGVWDVETQSGDTFSMAHW